MIENLIQSQLNDNFNQDILKAINKIRNKHKQQANVESIFEQIIKTIGNESISKALLNNRIETIVTDMLENKPQLENNSYCLTQKSNQLLLNIYGDITEPSTQSQDTPTKYFIASEPKNCGNEFLAFKKYIMEELNDLKSRLEVLINLRNASYSHKTSVILKEEIQILREDNKNKSITIENVLENKNLNIKLKNSFQALTIANDIEHTFNEVSNTTL